MKVLVVTEWTNPKEPERNKARYKLGAEMRPYWEKLVKEKEIIGIARLPGREVLLTQLVNVLASPVARFINVISSPIGSLIRSIEKIKEKIGREDDAKEKGKE